MSGPADCPNCDHPWSRHNEFGCYVNVGSASCDDACCGCGNQPPEMVAKEREACRVRVAADGCPAHWRYQVKRQPMSNCERCWRMWVEVNP